MGAGEFEDVNSLPPSGLLGLFQIKTNGRPPRPLDSLQYTFAADQFYLQALEGGVQSAVTPNSANVWNSLTSGAANFQVPSGKGWLVLGVSGVINSIATGYWRGAIYVGRRFGSTFQPALQLTDEMYTNQTWGTIAVGSMARAMTRPDPILLGPGDEIGAWPSQVVGTGLIAATWNLRFVEFPW